jgi:hypothetical protein
MQPIRPSRRATDVRQVLGSGSTGDATRFRISVAIQPSQSGCYTRSGSPVRVVRTDWWRDGRRSTALGTLAAVHPGLRRPSQPGARSGGRRRNADIHQHDISSSRGGGEWPWCDGTVPLAFTWANAYSALGGGRSVPNTSAMGSSMLGATASGLCHRECRPHVV